jgi:hypothetical protein
VVFEYECTGTRVQPAAEVLILFAPQLHSVKKKAEEKANSVHM